MKSYPGSMLLKKSPPLPTSNEDLLGRVTGASVLERGPSTLDCRKITAKDLRSVRNLPLPVCLDTCSLPADVMQLIAGVVNLSPCP